MVPGVGILGDYDEFDTCLNKEDSRRNEKSKTNFSYTTMNNTMW